MIQMTKRKSRIQRDFYVSLPLLIVSLTTKKICSGKTSASTENFQNFPVDYKPFPGYLFPIFQNESWCTTFQMEISLI